MAGTDILRDEAAAVLPLTARSDADDRLIAADPPLAAMQRACGGEIPGLIAAPDLLELVRKARGFGMRLARPLALRGGSARLDGWAEIEPDADGCAIRLSEWHASEGGEPAGEGESTRLAIENLLAEAVIWLGDRQQVLAIESEAADLARLVQRTNAMRGEAWTRLFDLPPGDDAMASAEPTGEPVWRARRGITTRIEGSHREWHLLLAPASGGYRILMRPASEPLPRDDANDLLPANLLRDQLAPAMHDPVRRIIRQAEAIRDRLAGPLPAEYREYAVDIVRAGKHLRELADELGDAEAIEHGTLEILAEPVAVTDVIDDARRLLQVRAEARNVTLAAAPTDAIIHADRRRTLQILLNIVGNAIDYGPAEGQVAIGATRVDRAIAITIDDDGHDLSDEDRIRMFDKFERLGRAGDSGSGLGLYIALMLARAMDGGIEACTGPHGGSRFTITLPSA